MARESPSFSKTNFLAGWQCVKRLYLQLHDAQLAEPPDASNLSRFEDGQTVTEMARQRFPRGVLASTPSSRPEQAVKETTELITKNSVQAIFEAAFQHNSWFVRVDILERLSSGGWRLIEVKASTELKRDEHLVELAFQKLVLEQFGVKVRATLLMYLNKNYVYRGGQHCTKSLFVLKDVSPDVTELMPIVRTALNQYTIAGGGSVEPEIMPGKQCTKPRRCEFFNHCNRPLPVEHVKHLPNLRTKRLQQLLESGVESLATIPIDFPLTKLQKRAATAAKTGLPYVSDSARRLLARLSYPLFFMDFETWSPAIPIYVGMHPFQPVPFQWSLHFETSPGEKVVHKDF